MLYQIRLLAAFALAAVDAIGWLCICFALAGPMLLSGVYETWLDMRLLRSLWKEIIFDREMKDDLQTNQGVDDEVACQATSVGRGTVGNSQFTTLKSKPRISLSFFGTERLPP